MTLQQANIPMNVCSEEEEANVACYKHYKSIEASVLTNLQERAEQLTVLKMEFCSLTAAQIELLADMLVKNRSITEVSVNGNPNEAQNFHLLLQGTKPIILSLKFCSINSEGVEKLSKELCTAFDSNVLHLNLSGNSIGDEGVKHVVQFLRVNRTLMSLNLADNKIGDSGCVELVTPLERFRLNYEENVLRRRMKFDIQKINMQAVIQGDLLIKNENDNSSKGHKHSRSSGRSKQASLRIVASKTFNKAVTHPFMATATSYEDGEYAYCKGNDALINLNLSYNKIGEQGLRAVFNLLSYQADTFGHDGGISRILIEGNRLSSCQEYVWKIRELLNLKTKKYSSGSGNKQRNQAFIPRNRS